MDRAGQRLLPLNLGILTYDVVALMRPAAQAKDLPIEHRLAREPDVPEPWSVIRTASHRC